MLRIIGMPCFLVLTLFTGTLLRAQNVVEHARIPLLREAQQEFFNAGPEGKQLLLQLPSHWRAETGSVVRVTLRGFFDPTPASHAIVLAWNGRVLATNRVESAAGTMAWEVPVPRPAFVSGWNALAMRVVLLNPNVNEPVEPVKWTMLRTECFLELNFTRGPLTDGLSRFPSSLIEERLLQDKEAQAGAGHASPPGVSVLLPGLCSQVHLRAAAIVSARLGQIDSLAPTECRFASLESWKGETTKHHGILIARRDQLGGVTIPFSISTALGNLTPGQGLLAEFFEGPVAGQHRVLLVTGADAEGLEKAALTLGSAPALSNLSSPAVLSQRPAAPSPSPAIPSATIAGLYQIQEFLKMDPWARQAAFVVPARLSLDVVRELFPLWHDLGRTFPHSPVLWPEVVTYRPGAPLAADRLRGRNVLALGTVSQWPDLLPPGSPAPAVHMLSPEAETLIMQGRRQKRSVLEPTLSFVQLLPSPWSSSNVVVLLGGMKTYTSPATTRLLFDPAIPGRLAGSLCAIDDRGRVGSYDLRQVASESFAERLHRTMPFGTGREETERLVAGQSRQSSGSRQWNARLSLICATVLGVLVAARLYLMWQQVRVRRQVMDEEITTGS